jgi:methylated-DNA-[protein]-cysteine S-methyltransferase
MSVRKDDAALKSYFVFKTGIGWCGVVSSKKGILRILIGYSSPERVIKKIVAEFGSGITKTPAKGNIADKITRYFSGEKASFKCMLDWSFLSPFQKKVLKVAMKVPYGAVESYGSLAEKAGCPKGSRAVGGALARNPFPLVVPCHRIVRGDGSLGGFSAGGGTQLKKKLLKLEGTDQTFKIRLR